MDYSVLFHSFLSSLVSDSQDLNLHPLMHNLIIESKKSQEISNLKKNLFSIAEEKLSDSKSLQEFISQLSDIIKDLEESIVEIINYSPLDHEIVLEFGRSLSLTTHPSPYSNEPPIPQDSKMRASLLFKQDLKENVEIKRELEENYEIMNWITTTTETKNAVQDLSLLDLDL